MGDYIILHDIGQYRGILCTVKWGSYGHRKEIVSLFDSDMAGDNLQKW